jgi:hypothetical protein
MPGDRRTDIFGAAAAAIVARSTTHICRTDDGRDEDPPRGFAAPATSATRRRNDQAVPNVCAVDAALEDGQTDDLALAAWVILLRELKQR